MWVIEIHEETYAALSSLKRADESFDEVLARLLEQRRVRARAGAGCGRELMPPNERARLARR